MNHNPSGDSAQTPASSQAVVGRTAVTDDNHQVLGGASALQDRSNPRLQEALGCLDVKLEDELNKFRSKQTNRLADTPPIAGTAALEQQSVDNRVEVDEKIITGEIIKSGVLGDTKERSGESIVMDGISSHHPQINLATITSVNNPPLSIYAEAENSTTDENLDLNFSPRGEIAPFHVGYLASSQELLDRDELGSTSESDVFEDPADSYLAPSKPQFFTFRKLSLMAMAWIVAGGAAYTYLNPNILAPLTAKVTTPTVVATGSLGQSIQSPNLAANEFTELNLSMLNTIKIPTAATATNVNTAATTASVNPSGAVKGVNSTAMPTAAITTQPQLADSLVKSLLPPDFHTFAKRVRTSQPMTGR
jgi:hypothetical protein